MGNITDIMKRKAMGRSDILLLPTESCEKEYVVEWMKIVYDAEGDCDMYEGEKIFTLNVKSIEEALTDANKIVHEEVAADGRRGTEFCRVWGFVLKITDNNRDTSYLNRMYTGVKFKGDKRTDYIVRGVEEVYDAFDVFEHNKWHDPIIITTSSLEDAINTGRNILQEKITKYRREGGYMSHGMFIARIEEVYDMDGNLLFEDIVKRILR